MLNPPRPMPITYATKTAAQSQCVIVRLVEADFLPYTSITPPVSNPYPGPVFYTQDFTDTANANPTFLGFSAQLDITQVMSSLNMVDLQSVYIDNSVNSGIFELINPATGQQIMCDAFSQGVFPIFNAPNTKSNQWVAVVADRTNLGGNVSFGEVSTLFTNAPVVPGANPGEAYISLFFTDAAMPIGSWGYRSRGCRGYDCSANLTAGGFFESPQATNGTQTANLIASAYRRGFLVHNPITAVEPLYVCLVSGNNGPAASLGNSFSLAPGQTYQERGNDAFTGTVHVMAATTGHPYIATLFF